MENLALAIYVLTIILMVIFNIYIFYCVFASKGGKFPPYVPSLGVAKNLVIKYVAKILEKSKKPLTVLDPGCGSGTLLLPLAKVFKQHKFLGIEWSKFPYSIAVKGAKGLKNVELIYDDMFKHSFKDADIIFCFVFEQFAQRLADKIVKDVKKDCIVISNGVPLPSLKLKEKIECTHLLFFKSSIFVYELKGK